MRKIPYRTVSEKTAMKKIILFIKKETVLVISGVLAILSMFAITPNIGYIDYIDFHTLALLLSLMAVMAGLSQIGVFSSLARSLLKRTSTVRSICTTLVLLCFFSSMLFTNDVALITFVPFAIETLLTSGRKKDIPAVVILQTIAANLGSMLTPVGNPQNLYLYTLSGISATEFILLMLPYTLLSLIMILISLLIFPKDRTEYTDNKTVEISKNKIIFYSLLFLLCLTTVAKITNCFIVLAIVIILILICDRKVLVKVDYSLILTFIFFFIFIGNLGNINAFSKLISNVLQGREVLVSVLWSQCMSNVPAAVLLSGFTTNIKELIIGTNLGGLGTLIASMASLISYKYIAAHNSDTKGKYLLYFSIINVVMLIILYLFHILKNAVI